MPATHARNETGRREGASPARGCVEGFEWRFETRRGIIAREETGNGLEEARSSLVHHRLKRRRRIKTQESPLLERLEGIHAILKAVAAGGKGMSSATKGREREVFIELFLRNVLSPKTRFGTGDIVDSQGHRSGQLDVVMELPFVPSLPLLGTNQPRLYLAEGVAAAVATSSSTPSNPTKWN